MVQQMLTEDLKRQQESPVLVQERDERRPVDAEDPAHYIWSRVQPFPPRIREFLTGGMRYLELIVHQLKSIQKLVHLPKSKW